MSGTGNQNRKREYLRKELVGDVLYWSFRYEDLVVTIPKKKVLPIRVDDLFFDRLVEKYPCQKEKWSEYENRVGALFDPIETQNEQTPEELFDQVCRIRRDVFGAERMEAFYTQEANRPAYDDFRLDEKDLILSRIKACDNLLIAITEPKDTALFFQWQKRGFLDGKRLYFLCANETALPLPTRKRLAHLGLTGDVLLTDPADPMRGDFPLPEKAFLLCFGEAGFFLCRDLALPAAVLGRPRGFLPRAACGEEEDYAAAVFIQEGFSLRPTLSLIQKTVANYRHLAKLRLLLNQWELPCDISSWHRAAPQLFYSVYDDALAEQSPLPFSIDGEAENFDAATDEAIDRHLNSLEGVEYHRYKFRSDLSLGKREERGGILVHAVKICRAQLSRVIDCPRGTKLRPYFREHPEQGEAIVSNFLFFLTPKLSQFHQTLFASRPYEKYDVSAGHLDYMLCRDGKQQRESFPLYQKMCIAKKRDGAFLFFPYRLGGGKLNLCGEEFFFTEENVNNTCGDVAIFTPYLTLPYEEAERESFVMPVGEGRVNFVVIGDRIVAARDGDVLLPPAGVVISLENKRGRLLLQKKGAQEQTDGYYATKLLSLEIQLDPPHGIRPEIWNEVEWCYGGGLGLIREGVAITDKDDPLLPLREEGWLSPLSRQTQESSLHTIAKHPRTAIGTCGGGDIILLVFSGRSTLSEGADYREMIAITRKIFPDVTELMNVDGGGSAVLGLKSGSRFRELSFPSTSSESCAGQIRPVNTAFLIPLTQKKKG